MKGNNNFSIIVIVIFMALAVFGIMVFSGLINIGGSKTQDGALGTVILWGTESTQNISKPLEDFNRVNKSFVVKYIQKNKETFDKDLLEALASGTGPDMFFISNDLIQKYSNKIYPISYQSYPLATFKSTFTGAGEVFLTDKGILAFPMTVDPMVMYYNRSMLDTNNVVYPPATWDELSGLVSSLTKKDENNKIIKSANAMGQFVNISHAKDILATMFLQSGNQLVSLAGTRFYSALDKDSDKLGQILKYYTDFSNPLSTAYSWNRSLPNSTDYFSADNLAFYFGYASELKTLINKNPNQNFSVAPIPQIKNSNFKTTNARVTGIAIVSSSKNLATAFTAASLLATSDFVSNYINISSTIPARRDLLSQNKTDAFYPIFYSSALYARSWVDPSASDSDDIFRRMIDGINSNVLTPENAIKDASVKLNLLLTPTQ